MKITMHSVVGEQPNLVQFTHNGVTLSVGMGEYHYCDARNGKKAEPENAEMAVWRDGQKMERIGDDGVAGWVPLTHLPRLLELLLVDNAEVAIATYLVAIGHEDFP